ncbi:hypothetical protein N7448_002195 [Penicillium atrosanguineum]|uniref:F-box domain-containing protein n=1 Tax=Penicillium atrosanguineum TaxID=1132637 RepID=A0A9W9LAI6_9EURO|nr:uncharacterized protein N7443_005598 [Penicillium atrosanguineum]KAJ5128475.1 hypothetical protein N7526_006641 [Penicillium atrosanguineum]KAJ5144803.1 hypothetical protein N7448_002195 [Penicillium atrosanguineum]KAJ5300596.1 hypothetical protein N7443_005598 [Penicillium atrosanguineum]KAJ5311238.1 hypothetical protein N7476_007098 [Penicillium atrosanguineum]
MDEVQTVLEHFRVLPSSSRRELYHGILGQLRRNEWRQIKERADEITFSCDILGSLPIEIVSLVAAHMNLADLVVSRRWKETLSSPAVQLSAIRSVMGHKSAAQIGDHSSPVQLIKKRVRMERGQPTSKFKLRSPFSEEYDEWMVSGGAGYFNDIYAWLDGSSGRTSISLLNLRTGVRNQVTTENREKLSELNISEKLVAAISMRGYCHVWDLETLEHKAFRLPSRSYTRFLISGIQILIAFGDQLVHWGFHSETARTLNVGPSVALLALDPAKDEFTVASLTDSSRGIPEFPQWRNSCGSRLQLRIEKYTIGTSNDFHLLYTKYQYLPFEAAFEWTWSLSEGLEHIARDQSSVILNRCRIIRANDDTPLSGLNQEEYVVYFSIDMTEDHIDVHVAPADANFTDQGLIYTFRNMDPLSIKICTATPKGSLQYYPVRRKILDMKYQWVHGDKNFVVFVGMEDVEVWSFDETWQPAEIHEAY